MVKEKVGFGVVASSAPSSVCWPRDLALEGMLKARDP